MPKISLALAAWRWGFTDEDFTRARNNALDSGANYAEMPGGNIHYELTTGKIWQRHPGNEWKCEGELV